MNSRAEVVFHGRVQGVFFRVTTLRFAQNEKHLTGWVKNHPDGTVHAVIEGPKDSVLRLISRCEHDQPHARVTKVDIQWKEPAGEFNEFNIR